MNFLQKIFTNKRETDLIAFISELKQDKERLLHENRELKEQLFKMLGENKKSSQNGSKLNKLTKKEQALYNLYSKNNNISIKELCKALNVKENSLKVYVSRIRSKGYNIEF